jgi:hemin uptake protein HemP
MTAADKRPIAQPGPETRQQEPRARREITSAELFGGGREIHIRHADEVYTLRQTNKGKLILTK